MDTVKVNESVSVSLWQLFHAKLVQLGIDPNQADWLVKWAEGFAKSMQGLLAFLSAADVLRYLEKTAQAPKINGRGRLGLLTFRNMRRSEEMAAVTSQSCLSVWRRKTN